jgi:hypothetical protein
MWGYQSKQNEERPLIEALGVFGVEMLAGIIIMILNVISSIYAF